MSNLDLLSLRAVLVLSETLNFREAAARLHMTQPALSVRLRRLEDVIGVRLFERSRSAVALSSSGQSLLPAIRRVIGEAATLQSTAQRIAQGELGRLRIGYTPISFMASVPSWIRRFAAAFPDVELELTELLSAEVEAALTGHDVDLGFLHPPIAEPNLETLALPAERYVIALPADDPLGAEPSLPLAALTDRDFVMTSRSVGPNLFAHIIGLCHASGFTPRIRQEVPTSIAVLGLVAAGHGVGLVIGACASMARSDLRFVPIDGAAPELPFSLAWRIGERTRLVDSFVSHVRDEAAELR